MTDKLTSETLQVISFDIILHSGNARTLIHEAFAAMREEKYEQAERKLQEADEEILEAHKSQTNLLKEYAGGTKIEMEIIMVHAQDHLMTTMTLLEVAREMSYLYQREPREEGKK
ncbi:MULTISPECIES: PTS cellobiose transporter subunit IIA [unclassified Enterococcus]|uniref:PTS cellobiose transporter subunit IIA n=1 Tax=unclassified Enterococcus TaxID=2608891 RepID=UPI0013EA14E7|nr:MULTISPECIES: PTS cellobiose transporter subunit IIA [unclassified Enterococcus]